MVAINLFQFAEYFKTSMDTPAPVIRVGEKNKYNVKIQYIEDIIPSDSNVSIIHKKLNL